MTQHRQPDPLDGILRHSLGRTSTATPCPAADVLAAYFERSLPQPEAARYELHFSACAVCQQQLAALARIETAVGAVAPPVAQSAPGFSFLNLRWLAPTALAAAGAVAIWVVVQPGVTPERDPAPVATAKNVRPESAPSAPAEPASTTAPAPAATGLLRDNAAAGNQPAARAMNDKDAPAQGSAGSRTVARLDAVVPPAAGRADGARLSAPATIETDLRDAAEKKKEAAAQAPPIVAEYAAKRPTEIASADRAESARAAEPQKQQAANEAEKLQKSRELSAQALSAGAEQQRPQTQDGAVPKAPSPTQQLNEPARVGALADESRRRTPVTGARQQEAPRRMGEGAPTAEQRAKLEVRPEFSVLAGRIQWRFYKSGIIERYDERVKGGDAVRSPVEQELLHASAPSEKICWAVGRGGVILRVQTASAWQQLGSPTDEDIVFIEARDAESATIRTRSGKTYITSDAARTWRTP